MRLISCTDTKESMKVIHSIRATSLLLLTAVLSVGCVNTDTAIIRSSRPAMTAFNRTTEPDENQVLELIAAERAQEEGDYEMAIRLFEDLLSQNPTMTDAYLGLGALYEESGNLIASETNYARAARLEPRNFDAQIGHGSVLESLKRYSEAIVAYQRALAIRPMSVEANLGAADTLMAMRRPKSALRYAQAAARLEPEDVAIRTNLATTLEQAGMLDEAIEELEIALELDEIDEEILLQLVGAFIKAKRWQEAVNSADTLVKIAPSAIAYEHLGRAHFRLGNSALSMKAYEDAVELDPDHWPSLNGLGVNALNAWLRSERTDVEMALEAREAFYSSLRVNPDQPKVVEILTKYPL